MVCVCARMHMHVGQTSMCRRQFLPFTVWLPGIELRSTGLAEAPAEPSHQPLLFVL